MWLNADRARNLMRASDLEGIIATTPENIRYVSGLESVAFLMSRYTARVFAILSHERPADPVVVTGLGDVTSKRQLCPPQTRSIHYGRFYRYFDENADLRPEEILVKNVVIDSADANPIDAIEGLVEGLRQAGLLSGRIGYDEKGVDPAVLAALKERLPRISLVPAWSLFREIRAVKTADELAALLASLRVTERGIQAAAAAASTGCSEADLIRVYRTTVEEGGGRPLFNEITFGRRSAIGASPITDGVLQEGDLIRFDIGSQVDGYCSDIARLFVYRGEISPRIRELYAAIRHGEEQGIQMMKPGVRADAVFEATCAAVRQAGIPDYRRTHVGHSIGLEVYEHPLLGPGQEIALEAGMVFEVETPYYELGLAGVQIEDTVVVGNDGGEMLTSLSREIEILE